MSELTVINETTTVDKHTFSALKNSVYPGAKDDSIKMVLSYCKARGLDPLQKPVHIVPMYVKDSVTGSGSMRDVVMPGIGLYRIQAQRSGCYAGQSDPEFGDEVTEALSGFTITYPKWCKITISKMMPDGTIVNFSAKEFWKENYATAGKDSVAPNAMWKKRPYAQLAKCAEAQALRKAFPDILDQSPTAEEMEGKTFFNDTLQAKKEAASEIVNDLILKKNDPIDDFVEEIKEERPSMHEQVKKQLLKAKSLDTLQIAADLIRECEESKQSELNEIYLKRQEEFKQ